MANVTTFCRFRLIIPPAIIGPDYFLYEYLSFFNEKSSDSEFDWEQIHPVTLILPTSIHVDIRSGVHLIFTDERIYIYERLKCPEPQRGCVHVKNEMFRYVTDG